jgi:glutamate/tyrosine decarboxylase-like PLP-dependent enzyme
MAGNPQELQKILAAAHEHALAYLNDLADSPVAAGADLATLRQQLNKPLTDQPLPAEQVLQELVRDVEGGLVRSAGGRFFGWVIGGALPAALAADWLTSAWDQNSCLYATSPAAAVVEEVVGVWLKDLLHIPAPASFALVTGTQMADVVCLAAARRALLTRHGWDLEARGMFGAPPIRLLASDQRHGTADRAVRLLGFGRSQLELLATDHLGRVLPKELEKAFKAMPTRPASFCCKRATSTREPTTISPP